MIEESVFQEPEYTNDNTFNSGVANLFNNFSSGTGTVTSLTQGVGISCSPNPITTSGTVSLDAELNNLNGVSITSPQTNQSLVYDGANWINQGMCGTSPLAFTALTDTPNTLIANDLIVVNSSGNEVIGITNNYKNDIVSGSGINVIQSQNSARILLDAGSLTENFSSNVANKFVIEDNNGNNRRIRQSNINNSGFSNDSSYITLTSLTATSPLTYSENGVLGTFGLSTGDFSQVNFNNGVSGILDIEHGGTSAGTSALARQNLGLVYNVDILSQSGPSFDNTLFGDNIFLQPSFFDLSVGASGSGYTAGTQGNIQFSPYEPIGISITGVGPSGQITSWTATGDGTSFLGRGNYPDVTETWTLTATPGSGADFVVTPEINYINFGTSTGSEGIGFRNNQHTIEIKQSAGLSWQSIFPITVDKVEDLITTGASAGDLFIYNGTSWISQSMTGDITINPSGGTSYSGVINPSLINANGLTISPVEFSYLDGVTSNIQNQIDEKVGTSNINPVQGDLIYYDNTGPSFWQPLSIGAANQILSTGTGTSIPTYEYLHDILVTASTTGISPASSVRVATMSGTSGADLSVPMTSILSQFVSVPGTSNNGLGMRADNNAIQLQLDNLSQPGVSLVGNDRLGYYSNSESQTRGISVTGFCESISGGGLVATSGTIAVDFTNSVLLLPSYQYGTSPQGAAEGSMVYFTDGAAGAPCVGIHTGSCWHQISIGAPITP